MSWHVVGDIARSRTRTHAQPPETGRSLGVAVFRIQSMPPTRRGNLKLMEMDESLEGESSADDYLAQLRFRPRGESELRVQATVQGATTDEDLRLRLEFLLPDEVLAIDEAPPADRCVELQIPYDPVSGENTLTFAVLRPGEEFSDQAAVVFENALVWNTPNPGDEWDGRRRPQADQTAGGYPIEREGGKSFVRLASNLRFALHRGEVPTDDEGRAKEAGRDGYGIYYLGRDANNCLHAAQMQLLAEYYPRERHAEGREDSTHDPYRALLAMGYDALGEGSTSAVNTYDNCVVTFAAGWSAQSKGMNLFLKTVAESPEAGAALREAFEGVSGFRVEGDVLQFDRRLAAEGRRYSEEAWGARSAVGAWARFVRMAEDQHGVAFTKADVRTFAEFDDGQHCKEHLVRDAGCGDCRGMASDEQIRAVKALAREYFKAKAGPAPATAEGRKILALRPLAAMAAYLHHGRPAFAKPVRDLLYVWNHASDATEMIALLVKIHVQQCGGTRFWRNGGFKLVERSLNNKFLHFQKAYGVEIGNHHWSLDVPTIQNLIPCFAGPAGGDWGGPRLWKAQGNPKSEEPAGHAYVRVFSPAAHAGYYDFGPRRRR